ncbi:hypothetical protein GBA52_002243 [Prunus armeniaca]|nr:hypothetical protein GBA52_002243 [Prunus armeniaca]
MLLHSSLYTDHNLLLLLPVFSAKSPDFLFSSNITSATRILSTAGTSRRLPRQPFHSVSLLKCLSFWVQFPPRRQGGAGNPKNA